MRLIIRPKQNNNNKNTKNHIQTYYVYNMFKIYDEQR